MPIDEELDVNSVTADCLGCSEVISSMTFASFHKDRSDAGVRNSVADPCFLGRAGPLKKPPSLEGASETTGLVEVDSLLGFSGAGGLPKKADNRELLEGEALGVGLGIAKTLLLLVLSLLLLSFEASLTSGLSAWPKKAARGE